METSIILSLITMFLFGIGNAIQKPAVEKVGAVKMLTVRGIVASLVTLVAGIVTFSFFNTDPGVWLFAILLSIVSYLGLYFFNYAFNYAKTGVVIPVASSRIIIITLISIGLLGEVVSTAKLLFMIPIIVGIILVSLNLSEFRQKGFKKGVIFALLAAFFWGITFPFFGKFSVLLGAYIFSFLIEFMNLIISIIQGKIIAREPEILPSKHQLKNNWFLFLLIGLTGSIASICMNIAYSIGNASIISAIVGVSPLISVLVGKFYLKEEMSIQPYVGALVIVIGIIGISLN